MVPAARRGPPLNVVAHINTEARAKKNCAAFEGRVHDIANAQERGGLMYFHCD